MSHYSTQYYSTTSAMPISGGGKDHHHHDDAYSQYGGVVGGYYPVAGGGHGSYSVSPPESEVVSTASGVPSYSSHSGYSSSGGYSSGGSLYSAGYPSAAASYAGSVHGGDYDSTVASAAGVDFEDYVQDRLDEYRNPIRMDACMATQAKTSGGLNATNRQVLDRREKIKARLAKARSNYDEGMKMVGEVHADLQWTHNSILASQAAVAKKHGKEYKRTRERYPSPDY